MRALLAQLCTLLASPAAPPRRILVAAVLNPREVVLNIGTNAGAVLGERFELLDDGIPIVYEGELLGTHQRDPVTVVVTEAQERLVVARLPWVTPRYPAWQYGTTKAPVLPDWVSVGGRARMKPY